METELWQVLMDNGLDSHIKILEENNIDKEILSELTEADYAKLGIAGESMRKMITLFSKNHPPEPTKEETAVQERQSKIVETALEVKKEESLDNSPIRRRLIDNGLSEYIEIFAKNKLDTLDLVSKLTESDLSELGITIIGDRKKIKDIFNIHDEQTKDNNVVVTQTVHTDSGHKTDAAVAAGTGCLAGSAGAIIGGLLAAGIVIIIIAALINAILSVL